MFTNIIENRGKEFSNLIKIGDYLARALRENVELFNVEGDTVTYLTENGSVISGNYSFKPTLKISNVIVEDSSVLEDKKTFELTTDKKVMGLLGNLLEDDYQSAEGTFDNILSMFETKLSYERIKTRLHEKAERFGAQTKIVSSQEFQRVNEIKDKIVSFLKENKNIVQSAGIRNGMKLTALVSASFDLPRLSISQLKENKAFEVKTTGRASIYDHLCKKELIQKELLEAKEGFDRLWVSDDGIQDLAAMIYENDEEAVRGQVAKVVTESPYFALATKKQLTSLIHNSLALNDVKVTHKELNSFAGSIFKMKSPVKTYVLGTLNEKYGIDVRKLSEVPTFRTLAMTEAEIIREISKHAPKGSLISKTLNEFASYLINKNGAETIDLADFLSEVFAESEYSDSLNETSLMDYMDFSRVADDLGKIGQVLKMLGPAVDQVADQMDGASDQMGGAGMPQPGAEAGMPAPEADLPLPGAEGPQDPLGSPDPMDSEQEAGLPQIDAQDAADEVTDEIDADVAMADGDIEEAPMDGEMPPEEGMEGELPPEEGMEDEMPPEEGMDGEMPPEEGMEGELPPEEGMEGEEIEQDELTSLLSKLEDLLGDLTDGEESDDEGEFDDGSGEFEEEGEEDFEDPEGEEEFEDEIPSKKKKKIDPEQYKS